VRKFLVLLLIASFLLAACSGRATATPPPATATSTSLPQPTAAPTEVVPLTILVLPADMAQKDKDKTQTMIYDLAQSNGMRFQVLNRLTSEDLAFAGPALKIVITLPPDPGLTSLAAAAPGVQFLAIGIPDLPAAANISTIGAAGLPVDQQAFLAGYIAGLIAPEWKVGILYQKDTPGGTAARDAFTNGFVYFCGSCRNPLFPQPAGIYPVTVPIPTDANLGEYNAYADILSHNIVKVAYVYPPVATEDVLSHMAQKGLLLIGQNTPGEDVRPSWIASIQSDSDAAIRTAFADLVAGKGGRVVPTPLFLNDVNPDLLSPGKQRVVQEVLDGLQNGTIGTGVTP
jgi:hypothetical protein